VILGLALISGALMVVGEDNIAGQSQL